MKLIKDIIEEFKTILKGNTLDAVIPPVLFLVLINRLELTTTLVISTIVSILLLLIRIYHKDKILYAVIVIIGVLVTTVFTYISNNASNFFLPDIIGTSVLIIITLISIIIKRPIAAYLSHITRGWDLNWFKRDDVRPAYIEVSMFWLVFFIVRLIIEIRLYFAATVSELAWANIILGFPVTIGVLTISYVYGIWRLHTLKGPGIDEFIENKQPPYKGQTKGF